MDDMTVEELRAFQERLSKLPAGTPDTVAYSTKQKINFLANIMVDRIIEDQKNGAPLLKKIERENALKNKADSDTDPVENS